jgi:hypothetical protein
VTEFSISTHLIARYSCNARAPLRAVFAHTLANRLGMYSCSGPQKQYDRWSSTARLPLVYRSSTARLPLLYHLVHSSTTPLGRDTKKRVSKACENSAQPGDTTSAPASILRKTRDPNAPKRALSKVKDELAKMKGNRRFALLTHKDKFARAAKEWKRFKEGQANEHHQRDIAEEDAREEAIAKAPMRAALKKVGKIPKKNEALSKAKAAAARVSARIEAKG